MRGSPGPSGEVALYQQILGEFGFDPGTADGYFGNNTWNAALREINANGNIDGPEGTAAEYDVAEGVIRESVFQRLG